MKRSLFSAVACGLLFFGSCAYNAKQTTQQPLEPKNWYRLDRSKLHLVEDGQQESFVQAINASIEYYQKADREPFFFDETQYDATEMLLTLCHFKQTYLRFSDKQAFTNELKEKYDFYLPTHNVANKPKITGYYIPLIRGSLTQTEYYSVPVYDIPNDLKILYLGDFRESLKNRTIVYRLENQQVLPYYSRKEIEAGAIETSATPIAWVASKIDLFFMQIQGTGILQDEYGRKYLLSYKGSNGQDYRSIGRLMVQSGLMELPEVSMQSIKSYLKNNPQQTDAILHSNPSYVFFERQNNIQDIRGSLNFPLVTQRSVAMDSTLFPKAMPLFLKTKLPQCQDGTCAAAKVPLEKIVFVHDTGGAIKGYSRLDLYFGSSDYGESVAGHLNEEAEFLFPMLKKEYLQQPEVQNSCSEI